MSLEMAASCRLLRRSLMHTFHNHWNLFAIISLLVNLAMLPLPNAQERILVSYGGHNEKGGAPWGAAGKGFFKKYSPGVRILPVPYGPGRLNSFLLRRVPPLLHPGFSR